MPDLGRRRIKKNCVLPPDALDGERFLPWVEMTFCARFSDIQQASSCWGRFPSRPQHRSVCKFFLFGFYFVARVALHLAPPAVPSIELPLTCPVYCVPPAVKLISEPCSLPVIGVAALPFLSVPLIV